MALGSDSQVVLGTCHHDCPDSCGWEVTVEDGVATKLRGNSEHPFSQGELCPKVNRFLDRVYSPDRILHPLRRSGPKGTREYEQISWDEALAEISDRWTAAIDRHGSETVLPWWDAGNQSLLSMGYLDQRFLTRLGATRLVGSLCGGTSRVGYSATNGTGKGMDPLDVRHSKLILLWGTNTRLTNRHLWPYIEEARADGAEVVVIDPIRTVTADAADHFVQPMPGTDVALMLAMMNVLIRDDLIDHDYVEQHALGYDELVNRARDWSPERAAQVCGLEASQIEWLATAYGTTRPVAIRTLIGAEHHEQGAMFFRAMACLPTLVGAWRDRGGGLARSTGAWTGDVVADSVDDLSAYSSGTSRRAYNMNHLGRTLTDPEMDPPVTALLVWNGNPAVTVPNTELIREGMSRDDLFIVVHEQFMTDTAAMADIVLPATTQIEQLDAVLPWGHLYVGMNHKAIEPLGETVSNSELFRRLSTAMGFTEPGLHADDEALLREALTPLGDDIDALFADGFWRLHVPQDLRPFAQGGFPTASGKAELRSDALERDGHDPLPQYSAADEGPTSAISRQFPLQLASPKQHGRFLNTSYTHLPKHGPAEGSPYLELDPADAAERGIDDGDEVRVFNDRGSLTLAARVSDRLRPGLVAVPFGWWMADYGGGSVNSLTSDTLTDWGGGVAYGDTMVQVAPV
jgi:anaerobic selenocysteine-containing dehydrogenase